jgi:hypothetical protein
MHSNDSSYTFNEIKSGKQTNITGTAFNNEIENISTSGISAAVAVWTDRTVVT